MVNKLQEGWSTVGHDHEHISPAWPGSLTLAGYTVPTIVGPYYRNGNVLGYLDRCPGVDRLDLVCQAASALTYIQLKGAIHGNVCPVRRVRGITLRSILTKLYIWKENICITGDGKVQVTDIAVNTQVRQTSSGNSQSIPSNWMYKPSEELEHGTRTMQADVCSFATTIYSVRIHLEIYDQ